MSVHVESPPTHRGPAPAHHRVPFVEVLRRYQDAGTVPFSCAGHKLGGGADRELVAMLGPELFAADVWLDTGTHDRALRAAEALAAAAWGADRCFFRKRLLQRQPCLPARHPRPGRRGHRRP